MQRQFFKDSQRHPNDSPTTPQRKVCVTPETEVSSWERHFGKDATALGSEILVHICGESCFKYSGGKVAQICRHCYYYVTEFAEWKRRRRGKPLRNTFAVVAQTKYGMQGRFLLIQEHPFECQSNYGALAALRCNFDVQDLRRVSALRTSEDAAELCWMKPGMQLPHIGNRPD